MDSGERMPLHSFTVGPAAGRAPTLVLVGGVHGLERVGTHVVLTYLENLFTRLGWERSLDGIFEHVRLVAVPLVNPGGMHLTQRSNPNGVDLMRNSPAEGDPGTPWLLGGHRISSALPWYRGRTDQPMELESRTLVDLVQSEARSASFLLSLDCHSGFGLQDRLWFPYARTSSRFKSHPQMMALKSLLDRSAPQHVYRVEQQSYRTHGDLWDHLYDEHQRLHGDGAVFLPLTLEMGSWNWVRKNPLQLFSRLGPFNPVKPHRYNRAMRRHLPLIDFLLRAALHHSEWLDALKCGPEETQ